MKYIILYIFLFLIVALRASDPYEVEVPSVFILVGEENYSGDDFYGDLDKAICSAANFTTKLQSGVLPDNTENVVVLDGGEDWVVAFYQKGNGRVYKYIQGEKWVRGNLKLNPAVVRVNKETYKAYFDPALVALPWVISTPISFSVRQTEALQGDN
jgi:hypothetical protein